MDTVRYAELHCLSNFTFLRGASHPEELVERAVELGYSALALTDECSMAGVVRAHAAARNASLKLIIGSEFSLTIDPHEGRESGKCGPEDRGAENRDLEEHGRRTKVVVLARDRESYADLCALITQARRAAEKGGYRLSLDDFERRLGASGCLVLWVPEAAPGDLGLDHGGDGHLGLARGLEGIDLRIGARLKAAFEGRLWLGVELLRRDDRRVLAACRAMARKLDVPLVAAGDVHMHARERRPLQDTLTAIRLGTSVDRLGFTAYPNAERHLRPTLELAGLYPPELLAESVHIAERIDFSLDELRYEYPHELVPEGETPASHLRALTQAGLRRRWPEGAPEKVLRLIERELALIGELGYEPYFLTVHDIVDFARRHGILCQGRGSAANSAVCYALGITAVNPDLTETLFERFVSKERAEPPDIDVDFEHQRREEVIQYIYAKYSRERAALAATVITYQPRSAVRDVGKALGFNEAQVGAFARSLHWWDGSRLDAARLEEAGLDSSSPRVRRLVDFVAALIGFPRHLSQHVGGFVISQTPLTGLVPIENAAMPDRTVIQWDKDDLEELGLLKVDVLGLGMLSAIRRCLDLSNRFRGRSLSLATIPPEDDKVYRMISRADTVGVFQIESRAQMAMLPRLKPTCYYDLVIEVAIVRPGPIQGDMVHPYLRRRSGEEPIDYPKALHAVLERTLGVPIFQEQVMQIAIVAAGFTPGEADELRRAMAAWRRRGDLGVFERRLVDGMRERGYQEDFARRIVEQIKGFGEYGFPESHSASFALLVYVSAWLKYHEPAAFFCALLNSQPMGFYAPAQLMRAARGHGVTVLPADVNGSGFESTLEPDEEGRPAIRLGLQRVKGLAQKAGERIEAARAPGPFEDVRQLARRAALDAKDLGALAAAGALKSLSKNRYRARWDVAGVEKPAALLEEACIAEGIPLLGRPSEAEDVAADYRCLGLTLGRHPLALIRDGLAGMRIRTAREVAALKNGARVHAAGIVITRQRPLSASGVTFVTLEDETGYVNLVVWQRVAERDRMALLGATLLGVKGRVQREGEVLHVVADKLDDYSALLGGIESRSRDFR
jgi:error-prone DNA polymerase